MSVVIVLLVIIALIVLGAALIGVVFQLLWWALVGLVIGALARLILPGNRSLGLLATALFGIVGGVLGGLIARIADLGGFLEFVVAVLVAAVLIALFETERGSALVRGDDRPGR